ncbi:MAG: hypothetical protein RSE94_00365 [Pseudomonas sp.]
MSIQRETWRNRIRKFGMQRYFEVLFVMFMVSPISYSGDCIPMCEGGKQNCLAGCVGDPNKAAACKNACYSVYDCPTHCANQKVPGGTQTQSAPKSPVTECSSNCSQQYSQCFTTCQGNKACYDSCGQIFKSCGNSCIGLQGNKPSGSGGSAQSQGQSTTQEVLNKVDDLNNAIQGLFGNGK